MQSRQLATAAIRSFALALNSYSEPIHYRDFTLSARPPCQCTSERTYIHTLSFAASLTSMTAHETEPTLVQRRQGFYLYEFLSVSVPEIKWGNSGKAGGLYSARPVHQSKARRTYHGTSVSALRGADCSSTSPNSATFLMGFGNCEK